MSIAELFESGALKQKKGHFSNLVMIARADGIVTDSEKELLVKLGSQIGLSNLQVMEIVSSPEKYPMNPPASKEERYERLIELVEMMDADHHVADKELNLVVKYGIGLGFPEKTLQIEVPLIENLVNQGKVSDEILAEFVK